MLPGLSAPVVNSEHGASMIAVACLAFALTPAMGQAEAVEILNLVDLGERDVPKGEAIDLTLPALPARDGHHTALRFSHQDTFTGRK